MRVARALKNSQLTCGERHAYFGDRTLEKLSGAREGRRSAPPPANRSRCRFDVCDVDSLGRLVQGSRNLYLLPGERRGLFLVAQ